jgi:hypothetical protein
MSAPAVSGATHGVLEDTAATAVLASAAGIEEAASVEVAVHAEAATPVPSEVQKDFATPTVVEAVSAIDLPFSQTDAAPPASASP